MAKKSKTEVSIRAESSGVNLTEIERLLAFMQSHALEELEYQQGDLHVRLKKASAFRPDAAAPEPPEISGGPAAQHAAALTAPPAPAASSAENVHTIKSPIVGTYYAAPSPDAEPFISVGAQVEAGQVLCIIEAMKLMNEIESDVAGQVVRIHVENGKPVEYGAALFDIRPRSRSKK